MYTDTAAIHTPYDCSLEYSIKHSRLTDISESIGSFQMETWAVLMLFFILISILLNIHYNFNEYVNLGGYWSTISFILKNPNIKEINFNSKLLLFTLAIGIFFILTGYFENSLLCDQVSVHQPHVYRSYLELSEDVNARVAVSEMSLEGIKNHNFESRYRNIYYMHFKSGFTNVTLVDKLVSFLLNESDIHHKAMIKEGYRQMDWVCRLIRSNRMDLDNVCFYEYVPETGSEEKEFSDKYLSFKLSQHVTQRFKNRNIYKKFHKIYLRSYDMGLISLVPLNQPFVTPNTADCRPQKLPITHNRESVPFKITYYTNVFIAISILFLFAISILLCEKFLSVKKEYDDFCKLKERRRRRIRNQRTRIQREIMINKIECRPVVDKVD